MRGHWHPIEAFTVALFAKSCNDVFGGKAPVVFAFSSSRKLSRSLDL